MSGALLAEQRYVLFDTQIILNSLLAHQGIGSVEVLVYLKALSTNAGVTLRVVTAADLDSESMRRLIPVDLCHGHVDQDGPYFKTLVRLSANHREPGHRSKRRRPRGKQRMPSRVAWALIGPVAHPGQAHVRG